MQVIETSCLCKFSLRLRGVPTLAQLIFREADWNDAATFARDGL